MPEVRAAGGVLWRYVDGDLRVALVHRPKYDDWSLPKGKLEPGEPAVVGGLREILEETGFSAAAGRTLGVSRYRVLDRGRDVEKTVQWWAMRAVDGAFVPSAEVDALRWLSLPSALARVTSGYDCGPLQAFAEEPPETTTVLLVRHASAGTSEQWAGDDDERPLDDRGQAQAQSLVDVLAAYAPTRVLSAPLVRCVDTVRPFAQRLGVPVEPVPAADEDAGTPALVGLLNDLVDKREPVVVCSQGGAIPAAVTELAGLPDPEAPKGSVWALSFSDRRLVDAHHTP